MATQAAEGSSGGDVPIGQQSGGGEESGDTLTFSGHRILIGTLNTESELTPYISEMISDRLTVSQVENVSNPLSINFSSRDIIFIADARNLSSDNATTNAFLYNALGLSGATIAAVYPNAEDVNNLENIFGIHFASPNDEPVDKHFEFIAVGRRYISGDADYLNYKEGDIPYNFVYVERSSKNESYFDASVESFDVYNPNPTYSDDAVVADSDDSLPNNTETEQANEEAQQEIISEQEANEAPARRVNELIIWSEGLNVLAGEVAGDVIRTASAFAVKVAAEVKQAPDDILKLVSGPHTTGDEIAYSSSTALTFYYAVVVGCTKGLTLQIWPGNSKGVRNIKIIPSLVVNKERSYSDTDGWNIGGGVSFGVGGMGGAGGFGNLDVSFNAGISHQSTKQWSASDYELVPMHEYTKDGVHVANWDIDVHAPYYTQGKGWTDFPTAARSSVTLESESIWQVSPDVAYTFDFTARADWKNGFMWARDFATIAGVSRYDCTVQHIGKEGKLNFARPPHSALSNATTSGTNEGRMYTAKIYTEKSWTAKSDSSWLVPLETSGGASMGENFSYTVAPNDTGMSRRGTITITSGRDKLYLRFDQSAYKQSAH